MAASSSSTVNRLEFLSGLHSKLKEEELESLYERFDIPKEFRVALPEKDDVAYKHGGDKALLYVTHLEYGLRLPLQPFVRKICERLGVSPMQLAPNAIAGIMAFLVICHRLGIEPSLQIFSHLFSVKSNKNDAHFFFVNSGRRLVSIPESNKDWKEKFVWIYNADPLLVCPTWPEVRRDVLKAIPLSPSERVDLARIKQYAGSRKMSNLFDPATIRVAGLSHTPPTEEDRERAKELAQEVGELAAEKEAATSTSAEVEPPSKKPRTGLSKEEKKHWAASVDEMATMLLDPPPPPAVGAADKKKNKGPKKPAPKKKAKAKAPVSGAATGEEAPPVGTSQISESPRQPTEVIDLDGSSPRREETVQGQELPPSVADTANVTHQADVGAHTAEAASGSGAREADLDMTSAEGLRECLDALSSFVHSLSDFDKTRWREIRAQVIGQLEEGYTVVSEPSEGDRFVPRRHLHRDDSVFLLGRSQVTAMEQFTLPKDVDVVREMPSSGLRLALASYFTRGALMSEELFSRLDVYDQACGHLQEELAREKGARVQAEKRVASLEAEVRGADSKWEVEMKKKQVTIATLNTHCANLTGSNTKLKEELAQHKMMVEDSQKDAEGLRERVAALERELEIERQARLSAQEKVDSNQLALRSLENELGASRASHQGALAELRKAENRLSFMTSDAGQREVIDSYRTGPIGKMEVTMAVKAGFDYLKAQLPQETMPSPGPVYPPRVRGCLETLLKLEKRGVAIKLDEEKEDGGDEDEEDEDDEDDEEGTGDGDGST